MTKSILCKLCLLFSCVFFSLTPKMAEGDDLEYYLEAALVNAYGFIIKI